MNRFGEKLRMLRNQRGLTLRQLGGMLEVDHSYVARLEKGEKMPNVAMVLKISQIFDVSTDVLIKDELEVDDGAAKNY
ncbi:MAG TPA: XRE family transcriptional regulator [Anaerolineae bacterium]|nr:XRE family transcriptional regulator [Anaerolineae bacterium]